MIDIKMIKKNILSAAYQGKLSRTADYTVKGLDELHASIKKYQDVTDSEKLIETPPHWKWSRLGYISNNHGQKTPSDTFSYIDVGTLDNVHQRLAKEENIILANDAPSRARKIVEYGDVIYSTVRPYLHNICIIDKTFSLEPIASTAFCVMSVKPEVIINKFLFYWLLTPEFGKYANGDPSKGTLYPAIGEKDLLAGVIPIPPLEEQAEIIEKVDEAFNALSNLEAAQSAYSSDLEVLKSKVIDAGIQGKLTEQLPEDGNAEDLYAAIQEEKERLIKEKKIKKSKALPEITEEEIPFEIPDNWKWVKLGNIASVFGGKRIPAGRSLTTEDTGQKYIRVSNMKNRSVELNNLLYVPEDLIEVISKYRIHKEDVYITVAGTIGEVGKIPEEIDGANLTENADRIVFSKISQNWLIYCLESDVVQKQISQLTTQVAQPKLAIKRIQEFILPLPPIDEQNRIVKLIESLLRVIY